MGLGRVEAAAEPRRYPRRLVLWCVFVALLIVVDWAGRISQGTPDRNAAYDWNVAAGAIVQYLFFLLVIWLLARGAWELLALRRPHSWGAALGAGAIVLVVVYTVAGILEPFLHPGREQGLTPSKWEPNHAASFAAFAFSVVILAPLAEELMFRGLGFGLLRPFGLVPPIVGTALLWALAHGLLAALPLITLLGIGLGWIRYRQDSTIPGMLVHATFNGIALAAALLV